MNKTFTINLNGRVYNINDDAYDTLHGYLENLKSHFSQEEGAQEIMEDIEARIGELFTERMRYGMEVVRLSDVEDVITIMGHPEEIEEPAAEGTSTPTGEGAKAPETEEAHEPTLAPGSQHTSCGRKVKRLFRDGDDKVVAGVCSGLGVYFNTDPWIFRALFLLLCFFGFGFSIFVYVLLWIIMPEAKTVAQKLQMRGEDPTVENIRNAINEGEFTTAAPPARKNAVGEILGFILKFIAVIAGLIFGLIALVILMFTGLFTLPFFFTGMEVPFFFQWMTPMGSTYTQIVGNPFPMFFASLVAIVLPVFALVQLIQVKRKNAKPLSRGTIWTLGALWAVAVGVILFTLL